MSKDKMPAIPPEDYKGSVGKWMIGLQEMGVWDGENPDWHGDVIITKDQWWELLKKTES